MNQNNLTQEELQLIEIISTHYPNRELVLEVDVLKTLQNKVLKPFLEEYNKQN